MRERQALLNVPNMRIYTGIAPTVGMLIFNWDEQHGQRFFRELRVRQALQIGLNRTAPIESRLLNQAVVANSPLLLNSWAYVADFDLPTTNQAQAAESLKVASIQRRGSAVPTPAEGATPVPTLTPDPTAPRFEFSILVWDDPILVGLMQELATQWSLTDPTTGIQLLVVRVENVPLDVYRRRLENAEFEVALVELGLSADPDVYAYWHSDQYPDGKNYGGAADSRISEILERARRETNGINRALLYRDFQRLFIERAIGIPLYYPLYTYAVNNTVAGVQLGFMGSPLDRFRTLSAWRYE
jgi:ABC-type transport system substrate-binding protein